MRFSRLVLGLSIGLLPAFALAQQGGQEWFVPGQGQGGQRPAQAQQRPAQPPAQQRPAQPSQGQAARTGQQPPAALIGIVDIPEVQRVSTAFNQVREEIERRRTRLNDDLQREQNTWREAQQQLATQRATLNPEQIRQRERELQDRITDSQRIFRNRSQAIEQAAQQALSQIEESLANVVRQVAAGRSVNIVLPRPLVIMNEPAFDMTEEVSQQFNRILARVNIPADSDGSTPPAPPPQQVTPRGQAPAPAAQGGQRPAQGRN
ncbi:OmpH family outer membrane protein [Sabulicella glaciei]|uniref:OmpH family outer membrane protein n=1 Tax=Sabulicella glaciei TaxID=2984948 RepID=A0ABT3NPJ9_9PROT|nr:OmpH family outer membrane protein [Roseococcus sp. MDT2-1-1]MCW8084086.1 OmpH family outer membrane protein [Roseococcus sp. MDT2-1-1]